MKYTKYTAREEKSDAVRRGCRPLTGRQAGRQACCQISRRRCEGRYLPAPPPPRLHRPRPPRPPRPHARFPPPLVLVLAHLRRPILLIPTPPQLQPGHSTNPSRSPQASASSRAGKNAGATWRLGKSVQAKSRARWATRRKLSASSFPGMPPKLEPFLPKSVASRASNRASNVPNTCWMAFSLRSSCWKMASLSTHARCASNQKARTWMRAGTLRGWLEPYRAA